MSDDKEIEASKPTAEHVEVDSSKDARLAAEAEHQTTLLQALKQNRKAAVRYSPEEPSKDCRD